MSNNDKSYKRSLIRNEDSYSDSDDDNNIDSDSDNEENELQLDEDGNIREGFIFKKIRRDAKKRANSMKNGITKGFKKILRPVTKQLNNPKKLFKPVLKPMEGFFKSLGKELNKGFDFLKDLFEEFGKILEDLGKMILEGLKKGFEGLMKIGKKAIDGMLEGFKKMGEFFKMVGKVVSDGFMKAINSIGDFFESLGQLFTDIINDAINSICKFFNNVGKTLEDGFNSAIDSMEKGFYDSLKWLQRLFKKLEEIGKFFRKLLHYIRCGIKMIVNFPKCIFIYLIDAIVNAFMIIIWLIAFMFQFESQWLKFKKNNIDKYIKWPNNISNTCFRCKNKSEEKEESAIDDILTHFMKTIGNMGWLNFGMFMVTILVMLYSAYFFHYYLKENEMKV